MHYEVKSKISSALVQLTVHFLMKQNEQKRNLKKKKNASNSLSKFQARDQGG